MHGTDTPRDDIILGSIRVLGLIHNHAAINTVVTLYADPEGWQFKQFVSQHQLEQFAAEHNLAIQKEQA
jgi:hypothetical protein